jgi:putative lipoprotein
MDGVRHLGCRSVDPGLRRFPKAGAGSRTPGLHRANFHVAGYVGVELDGGDSQKNQHGTLYDGGTHGRVPLIASRLARAAGENRKKPVGLARVSGGGGGAGETRRRWEITIRLKRKNVMSTRFSGHVASGLMLGALLGVGISAQETSAPPAHNNVRKAIRWKHFDYTCAGGAKLAVDLGDELAKVSFAGKAYLMKQTMSADGNRYSDEKVVWWGKGNGGFLQEDTPEGNGKMIVQGCQLDKPLNGGDEQGTVTGTVSYLQRMALPTNAVIQVQLLDVSLADAAAKAVAEESINLGQRQVPVPFSLNFDPAKIDAKHRYSLSAKITVDGKLWFISDRSYPVLTSGNPTHVDLILKQASGQGEK